MLMFVTFSILSFGWTFAAPLFDWPDFQTIKWKFLIVCAALSLLITGIIELKEHRRLTNSGESPKLTDEDLHKGMAAVEQLDVEEVVEINERDDEGAGFLLSLKDGRVLCLIGQDLYPYSFDADPELSSEGDAGIFPSDKIEFVYAPRSGIVLSVMGKGRYLKPKSIVTWPEKRPRAKLYVGPIPDSFNEGPLEELISRTGFIEEPL